MVYALIRSLIITIFKLLCTTNLFIISNITLYLNAITIFIQTKLFIYLNLNFFIKSHENNTLIEFLQRKNTFKL